MADRILVFVPGGAPLGFKSAEEHLASLGLGREMSAGAGVAAGGLATDPGRGKSLETTDERLLMAAEIAELTGTKASWWEAQGNRGTVPSYLLGRWRRFKYAEVMAAGVQKGHETLIGREPHREQLALPLARRLKVKKS